MENLTNELKKYPTENRQKIIIQNFHKLCRELTNITEDEYNKFVEDLELGKIDLNDE